MVRVLTVTATSEADVTASLVKVVKPKVPLMLAQREVSEVVTIFSPCMIFSGRTVR